MGRIIGNLVVISGYSAPAFAVLSAILGIAALREDHWSRGLILAATFAAALSACAWFLQFELERRSKAREERLRRTAPELHIDLRRIEDSSAVVVIDAGNDVPFTYTYLVVTANNKVVSGIPLGWEQVHPTPETRRFNFRAHLNMDQIAEGYLELRFRFESLHFAALGRPPQVAGSIVQRYRLVDGRVERLDDVPASG